jgi:hypothetical protein
MPPPLCCVRPPPFESKLLVKSRSRRLAHRSYLSHRQGGRTFLCAVHNPGWSKAGTWAILQSSPSSTSPSLALRSWRLVRPSSSRPALISLGCPRQACGDDGAPSAARGWARGGRGRGGRRGGGRDGRQDRRHLPHPPRRLHQRVSPNSVLSSQSSRPVNHHKSVPTLIVMCKPRSPVRWLRGRITPTTLSWSNIVSGEQKRLLDPSVCGRFKGVGGAAALRRCTRREGAGVTALLVRRQAAAS